MTASSINDTKIRFSVNLYDQDGDPFQRGIYIHIGPVVLTFKDPADFKRFWESHQQMQTEIEETWARQNGDRK